MGAATIIAAVALTTAVVSGAVADGKAQKAKRKARNAKQEAKFKLEQTLQDRQDIINPYDEIEDLSGTISNPFANLGVATQAAQMH